MKKRKEINAFSVSFLDILAGALGAVIILFIVVPKIDLQDIQKLKTLHDLEMQIEGMDSLLFIIKNSIPTEDYEALIEHNNKIQATIGKLKEEIENLQGKLAQKTKENEQLRGKNKNLENELTKAKEKINDLEGIMRQFDALKDSVKHWKRQARYWKNEYDELPKNQEPSIVKPTSPKPIVPPQPSPKPPLAIKPSESERAVIDINPPLAVFMEWDDPKMQLRLYMQNKSSGLWCFHQAKRRVTPFGTWQTLKKLTKKPHEAIIQKKKIVPGIYEIHAVVTRPKSEASTPIKGYVAMKPNDKPIRKIPFTRTVKSGTSPLKGGKEGLLGTLTVTKDNITWK